MDVEMSSSIQLFYIPEYSSFDFFQPFTNVKTVLSWQTAHQHKVGVVVWSLGVCRPLASDSSPVDSAFTMKLTIEIRWLGTMTSTLNIVKC